MQVTLRLQGELGIDTLKQFQQEVEYAQTYGPKRIVLDLKELDFIDSSGVRALVDLFNQGNDNLQHISVINIGEQVYSILELIGLVQMFGEENFYRE